MLDDFFTKDVLGHLRARLLDAAHDIFIIETGQGQFKICQGTYSESMIQAHHPIFLRALSALSGQFPESNEILCNSILHLLLENASSESELRAFYSRKLEVLGLLEENLALFENLTEVREVLVHLCSLGVAQLSGKAFAVVSGILARLEAPFDDIFQIAMQTLAQSLPEL